VPVNRTRIEQGASSRLESGGIVPISGIYRLDHENCSTRDFWLRKGERFPVCPHCIRGTAFLLQQAVEHISEDPDFE
jgi:hypothetical protein